MIIENNSNTTEEILEVVKEALLDKKAVDIKVVDLREVDGATFNFFVIANGTSDIHVGALARNVEDKMIEEIGLKPFHAEGLNSLNWVLLDYFDVIVHVFKEETRKFYNLEGLWADASIDSIEDK